MARKADILYVHHYYTAGTAAKKVAVKVENKKKPLPLFEPLMMAEPDQKVVVKIDPLSVAATLVAVALVVMMVVSLFQYSAAYQRNVELQKYVYTLSDENVRLQGKYQSGFDLAEIEEQALALGMIPIGEAQTIEIAASIPARAAEPTRWERLQLFMSELFA